MFWSLPGSVCCAFDYAHNSLTLSANSLWMGFTSSSKSYENGLIPFPSEPRGRRGQPLRVSQSHAAPTQHQPWNPLLIGRHQRWGPAHRPKQLVRHTGGEWVLWLLLNLAASAAFLVSICATTILNVVQCQCLSSQPAGEVESFCADLNGRLHVNAAVRMSVDKLHDLLFSADTHFIQHLFSQRHFTGTHTHKHTPF